MSPMTAAKPIHTGNCALCGCRGGVHYVIDPETDKPCYVCTSCERIMAKERRRGERR